MSFAAQTNTGNILKAIYGFNVMELYFSGIIRYNLFTSNYYKYIINVEQFATSFRISINVQNNFMLNTFSIISDLSRLSKKNENEESCIFKSQMTKLTLRLEQKTRESVFSPNLYHLQFQGSFFDHCVRSGKKNQKQGLSSGALV